MNPFIKTLLTGLLIAASSQVAFAQEQIASVDADSTEIVRTDVETSTESINEAEPTANPQAAKECKVCRWFEPTTATLSFRYRTLTDNDDVRTLNHSQHRIILGAKFNFDSEGKYSVVARASSGYYFNWAYADHGIGGNMNTSIQEGRVGIARVYAADQAPKFAEPIVQRMLATQYRNASPEVRAQVTPQLRAQFTGMFMQQLPPAYEAFLKTFSNTKSTGWNLFVRQLYFEAKPVKGLEFQYGSLGINKGVNTEATSYDDDGYVSGGRVSLKRPDKLWFDEMSATYAYFGDIITPNFFRRAHRLNNSNYHQFLVRKKLDGRAEFSTDYTSLQGTDTMREAVKLNVKESKMLDSVLVEAYQRFNGRTVGYANTYRNITLKEGNGFAVSGEKTLFKRLTLSGGFSNIDRDYTVYTDSYDYHLFGFALNGDQTGLGKRFTGKVNYQVTPELGISMLMTKAIKADPSDIGYMWNKSQFNMAITYDLLKGLKRTGLF